jgi:hypothetical protein
MVLPMVDIRITQAVLKIKYFKDVRTEGLSTNSRIFGYRPRETIRKDFCSSTSLVHDFPDEHKLFADFAKTLDAHYKKYVPEIYKVHQNLSDEKILEEWKMQGSPFTSGIINKNNPLKYHYDSGNFTDVYSNMLALKRDVQGGYLAIPEYDVALEIANHSISLFDGQKLLHGVTPILYSNAQGYRYTIVYYTLKKMWNCEPLTAEIARIKKLKTQREQKRHDRMTGKIENKI